jgi:hypothetical protein
VSAKTSQKWPDKEKKFLQILTSYAIDDIVDTRD